jgi:hypothetical protein
MQSIVGMKLFASKVIGYAEEIGGPYLSRFETAMQF